MKHFIRTLIISVFALSTYTSQAQLITKFTWDGTTNPSQATYGPNATSISSSAVISSGGANGTNGLNAGTPTHDIDMILPGSYYTLPGLDISVDFRRKESDASFFMIGNLDFGMAGGTLYAKFAIVKGSGDTVVSATNLYSLPSDNAFHTYRFIYNNNTGGASVSVDGTPVYTFNRTPASLYWTGAGNVTVGNIMDGTGSNVAILDNLIVQVPAAVTLPLSLLSFDVKKEGSYAGLNWQTTKELNTAYTVVERAVDGASFQAIGTVAAHGEYAGTNSYEFTDSFPAAANYYRLKMVDVDGAFTYSAVKSISMEEAAVVTLSCFPNPFVDHVTMRIAGGANGSRYNYMVTTLDGRTIYSGDISVNGAYQDVNINLSSVASGLYFIRVQNIADHSTQVFKVVKR